jgi:hypothetical protein
LVRPLAGLDQGQEPGRARDHQVVGVAGHLVPVDFCVGPNQSITLVRMLIKKSMYFCLPVDEYNYGLVVSLLRKCNRRVCSHRSPLQKVSRPPSTRGRRRRTAMLVNALLACGYSLIALAHIAIAIRSMG